MALRFEFEDRGFGRVYVALEAELEEGAELLAVAAAPTGAPVPVSVFKAPKPGVFVLSCPLMDLDYRVELRVHGAEGHGFEGPSYIVSREGPALEPPASQLIATGLADIRYVDLRPTPDAVWLEPTQMIDFEDGTDVVHADVVALFPEGERPGDPELYLLDLAGRPIEVAPAIVLSSELEEAPGLGVIARCQISFRIPRELETYLARVMWGEREGFTVVEPWLSAKLRREWWEIARQDSNAADFHAWFLAHGRASDRELRVQSRTPLAGPLFSVITPVFETPLPFLEEAVDSVLGQTYSRFELILVNASPENAELSGYLEQRSAEDDRIRVLTLEGNRGIALNTRAGLDIAHGDYVAFFDHDDVLEPNALYEYAKVVVGHPDVALLYCDEDYLIDGRFCSGYFKPDFDLDLLFNQNYVTHLLCVSRKAIDAVAAGPGLPGPEVDGAQDYALTLLVALSGARVWHVRKFLYHWRSHAASSATNDAAKTWTDDAGRRALEIALHHAGIEAEVRPGLRQNFYDVAYELSGDERVSVIVSRRSADDRVLACVRSLLETPDHPNPEIVVVNPFEPLGEVLGALGSVREVAVERACGIARERNAGARATTGDYLLFLDDACAVRSADLIRSLLGPLVRSEVAVSGAALYYPDDLVRSLGLCAPLSLPRFVNHLVPIHHFQQDYYAVMPRLRRGVIGVSGSAMLVRRSAFDEVGGFDEGFATGYDDADLCLRLREAGRLSVEVPAAELTFFGEARNGRLMPFAYWGQAPSPRDPELCVAIKGDEGRFRHRWGVLYSEGDPYYSPNLAREHCHYQMSAR